MAPIRDLTGQVFGKLLAVRVSEIRSQAVWECLCECGKTHFVLSSNLTSGNAKSCGCARGGYIRHGKRNTPEYRVWVNMKDRCYNRRNKVYSYYGGRGIEVCPEWRSSFTSFLADMGKRPMGHTLERRDNSKGYCKSNCHWATRAEQNRNTRRTRLLTINGKTQCFKDWREEFGIAASTVEQRIARGMSVEQALTSPKKR